MSTSLSVPRTYLVYVNQGTITQEWLSFMDIVEGIRQGVAIGIPDIVDTSEGTRYTLLTKVNQERDIPINGEVDVLYLVESTQTFWYYCVEKEDYIPIVSVEAPTITVH